MKLFASAKNAANKKAIVALMLAAVIYFAAPRRAAVTPGIFLSHVPGLPHVDIRAEAAAG